MKNLLAISALASDQPGLVKKLSKLVFEHECNVVDSRMMVLGGEFAMILLVSGNWNNIAKLESSLKRLEEDNLTLMVKPTEEKVHKEEFLPYFIEVISIDHPGIVYQITNFFSQRSINIEDLQTNSYAAAHTGSPLFSLNMRVNIPTSTQLAEFKEQFLDMCDEYNLDAVIEPIKNG